MHLLEQFRESPRACAYLPGESASLDIRLMLEVTPGELDSLLTRGWRRFGPIYFRPQCPSCSECVSLRVVVGAFAANKSQRRAKRACGQLRRVVGPPRVDAERLALYGRWHGGREDARGWESNPQTAQRYALEFAFPHPCAKEAAFYDDNAGGRLVGIGLFDETPQALSAAFFFYDPTYARFSLGTGNVMSLVDDAREANRKYLYLGYRVLGCASLQYKSSFRPHEILTAGDVWAPAE